jgi:hypothetical protein
MWILPKQLHTSAYVPDTEALNLDLNESSQLCAQSLFVRSKPSPLRTWLQKWKRDSWTQHLFGRILRPSHGKSFVTAWTSSLEDTRVSHSPAPASEPEQTTQDIFGPLLQVAFDFFDQSSVSSRTSKDTLALDSEKLLENWKALVTKRRGEYSARLNAVRLTKESECSSWPSPVASEVRQGFQDRSRGMKGSQELLTTVVLKDGLAAKGNHNTHGSRPESWATPRAEMDSGAHRGKPDTLHSQIKAWATPRTKDAEGWMMNQARLADGKPEDTLTGQVKAWATRSNSMTAGRSEQMNCRAGREGYGHVGNHLLRQTGNNGKLNPRWVETLMGLPVGWTMPSCQSPVTIGQTS